MSEPSSPTFPEERTYRFISDPGHKENLSGRVRAACMTCRRKKIKCSGEINCRTCREKGLVCEGLPERKRPRRDGSSVILDPVPSGGIERKTIISPTKKSFPKRPSISPLNQVTPTGSEDSGYASTQAEDSKPVLPPTTSQLKDSAPDTKPIANRRHEAVRSNHHIVPSGLRVETWRLNSAPSKQDDTSTCDVSHLRPRSEVSPGAQPASAAFEPSPVDWSQVPDNDSWWMENTQHDAPDLISTARALEEQAQSLRLMATRQQNNHDHDINEMMGRRQTIAFPLDSPSAFEQRYDVLQNQYGIFDDMALLLANRTPGTGMTPGLNDVSSWWDINAGDLILSPGQTMPTVNMGQQQTNIFNETPTSQAAQDLSQQPQHTSQDGYFGQFWPE